jgi:hypothetical protein
MRIMIQNDNANSDNNNDDDIAIMSDSTPKASVELSDDSMASMKTNNESD